MPSNNANQKSKIRKKETDPPDYPKTLFNRITETQADEIEAEINADKKRNRIIVAVIALIIVIAIAL